MSLPGELHVYDPRPEYPFQIAAKKYIPKRSTEDGYTLILSHGTGYHKEQWEPALERLFELAEEGGFPIREAWGIDCPNHGDSAVLNAKVLQWGYSKLFDWHEYGRSIHLFLTGYQNGYFSHRKLIGIAHSMGAVGMTLSTTYFPKVKFDRLVFCEPMMFPPGGPKLDLATGAEKRRDIWPSKQEAFDWLSNRSAFKIWDKRVLKRFCEDGMTDLPTVNYPDQTEGVTLKCYKVHEAASYGPEPGKFRALEYMGTLYRRFPVHLIFGGINDYLPREVNNAVINAGGGGALSVQRVEGSGHLVVQRKPIELAACIFNALQKDISTHPSVPKSKL
ncbi:hypothetical protein SISSUDRAFT_1060517 [Sistotremastrum suecicum HHB10207 ss-3]|uniref:AB hydrolase-1 domain-containing protein n=1 Tax=Sistotremastrum suecicum HHB10207 ss-3 TaxID=1314776 RepID=A0A166F0W8_9AGAM|nr:hypothetical protein SISSUDRAFT_1060517 [Sistotremastrum suecicum HHB10207 ss-3]